MNITDAQEPREVLDELTMQSEKKTCSKLNREQSLVYNVIIHCIYFGQGGTFFIDEMT